jgi:putative Holliday junction resolvase
VTSQTGPDATLPEGVRLGIDVGTVRVGLAMSDPRGVLAHPVATVAPDDTRTVDDLVVEHGVCTVYVGLPRTLRGDEGPAATAARGYARHLASRVAPVPVRLVDERLTTVSAHRQLGAGGMRERGRRSVVDQAAAVLILQGALDLESSSGRPAGELVSTGRKPRHVRRRKEHG